jgi:hypothetical protein
MDQPSIPRGSPERAVFTGRYALFSSGQECGEERWRLESGPEGHVMTGMQELVSPHPFPSRQEYRATLTRAWRPTGLEILWRVGERTLVSTHRAEGGMWRVRIEYEGRVREQEGDFPEPCEVDYGTHLFNTVILARREFEIGGQHEFPVLRIGPPYMAVSPERLHYRCVEQSLYLAPYGVVPAKRYVVTLPPQGEETGYSLWADEDGFVLESYEALDPARRWMKLVELRREA